MTQDNRDNEGAGEAAKRRRDARSAAALRANLQKRKAQSRARKPEATPTDNDKNEGS
ncbi:hypothetical protein SAMN05216224_11733 [Thioclava dalianensis]|uniref:hypothetical protein n=1 Tax=Thioclava dalianensis TaxID=1185766 RepID=UPI0008F68DAA|nr:hypothetical protein [Thioclava dalianensis]SFN84574.1 hypothetical protein SAMN05216224_11733 [Thioclava dalianensis]